MQWLTFLLSLFEKFRDVLGISLRVLFVARYNLFFPFLFTVLGSFSTFRGSNFSCSSAIYSFDWHLGIYYLHAKKMFVGFDRQLGRHSGM